MNKLLSLGVATLAVAGVVGVGSLGVSALNGQGNGTGSHNGARQGGGYQASLESRAKIVNKTVDQLKKELETKTMSQIAVESGLSEETFRAKMAEASKARWEARGLSSEEIAKRVADREQRHASAEADGHVFGGGDGNHRGGYSRNR